VKLAVGDSPEFQVFSFMDTDFEVVAVFKEDSFQADSVTVYEPPDV
jgi:hypothetical protein